MSERRKRALLLGVCSLLWSVVPVEAESGIRIKSGPTKTCSACGAQSHTRCSACSKCGKPFGLGSDRRGTG